MRWGWRGAVGKAGEDGRVGGGGVGRGGVIGGGGLVGVETMRDRLVEDHVNARALADGLAAVRGIKIEAAKVVTNIVAFEIDRAAMDAGDFQKACADRGLRISRYLGNSPRLRMVTHANVSRADVDAPLSIMSSVLPATRQTVTAAD